MYPQVIPSDLLTMMSLFFWFTLAISVFMVICNCIIFKKAGRSGWAAIVPFYSSYILFDIVFGNGILFLLSFIPFVNLVVFIVCYFYLAKSFGKGTGFGIGMVLCNIIFLPLLAFDKSKYIGPMNK